MPKTNSNEVASQKPAAKIIMSTKNTTIGQNQFTVAPHLLDFNALDPNFNLKIKRKNYPQKSIYTLRNMLNVQECKNIIQKSEKIGFQAAGLAIGQDIYRKNTKARNNKRVMFEDQAMADTLWQRIAHLSDPKFENHRAYGLNWRFRVYKYNVGGIFAQHVDERMVLSGNGLTTFFTFMVYLNENFEGGTTTFFDRRRKRCKKLTVNRVIRPKTGMALAFDHLLFHEGCSVTKRN